MIENKMIAPNMTDFGYIENWKEEDKDYEYWLGWPLRIAASMFMLKLIESLDGMVVSKKYDRRS